VKDIVVSFDFFPQIGGAHTWLYEVYRRWSSEVALLTVRYSHAHEEQERQREFDARDHGAMTIARAARPVHQVDLLDPRSLWAFASHVRAIERLRRGGSGRASRGAPLRLHALRAFPEGFSAYLYRLAHPRSTRLITYAHGEEVLVAATSRQLRLMARRVYAASDLVIANSENTRQIVRNLCPTARIECIHPGVEVADFARTVGEVERYRAQWPWPRDTVIVCTLARMEPRKNHAAVIRAVSQLRREGLSIALVCGGDGPEKDALVGLARSLGVGDSVLFTGSIAEREKPLMYCASDIYAMPSVQVGEMIEGFGIVFLEAAAAGLPVVCGNSGGQPEAVLDGRTGWVVDGRRMESVVGAIKRLVRDAAERARMGQAARVWAAEHDWANAVGRIARVLERLEPVVPASP